MAFTFETGDLFHDNASALVNTVNCVGVMGKGIALSFKRAFPQNYKAYKNYCLRGQMKPGGIFIFYETDLLSIVKGKTIVNFATKKHWRSPSKIEWIDEGLIELNKNIISEGITSIAIPPLGCGNGGLEWEEVLPLILTRLGDAAQVCDIKIYGQKINSVESIPRPEHTGGPLPLNDARALLLLLIGELESHFGGAVTKLSAHKLFYFAQQIYGNLGVEFSNSTYGPFSSKLEKGLRALNKADAINGYYSESGNISVSHYAFAEAREYADANRELSNTVEKLSRLVDGFESPLGMELLGTTHFASIISGVMKPHDLGNSLSSLPPINRNQFDDKSIGTALERLKEDGLLKTTRVDA